MQPIQYDLRSPAAKDNSITHAATAWSNLDAAITMWVAKHNRTTRNGVGNCSSRTGFRRQSEKKTILKHFLKGFLEGKSLAPKWRKKRISCETSFKTPSATHPPAPLAIPFTLRERSYSCKSQWNSVGRTCTKNTWNPIYNAEPIRPWSEHDPTTHETVSQPSHRRGRSSRFGDRLCMEKHGLSCICYLSKMHFVRDFHQNSIGNSSTSTTCNRTWSETVPTTHETVSHPSHRRGRSSRFGDGLCMEKHKLSCICYLSKTHFVRDFLQNSIGNSSTSTTCNPIYSEGTILELQITMEFHQQLIHQHHLQSHLHCGNDPTVANHNGILSTAHARKTLETPFTMRNRSDHDPNMIRDRSDHTRDRLAPVAPQR